MGLVDDILKALGILPSKKSRRGSAFPSPPDPSEIKEGLDKIVEGITELKEIPKSLMDRAVDAEEDFREADRTFRGTRFKTGKKRK